jgi:hypothetical protein
MSYLSHKIGIVKDALMGNLMKLKVLYDIRVRQAMKSPARKEKDIIISLTSYGKRVKGSAIYAIYSLLNQTVGAERIVLWLDEKTYNSENLPKNLRHLCDYGLEVRYAKDMGAYTKLIHSLKEFPDKHIITADDDIYYTKTFIEELAEAHHRHTKAIIAGYAKMPTTDGDNRLKPYTEWPEYHHVSADFEYDKAKLFPLGWAGVLYPAHTFDEEVTNEEVFTRLCPKADDVWLYVMGLRCQAEKRLLKESRISYYHTDLIRQLATNDRLTATNRLEGENDKQLAAVLEHYHEGKNEIINER